MLNIKLNVETIQRLQRLLAKQSTPPFDEDELAISSLDYALREAMRNNRCEVTAPQIYREHSDGYTRYIGNCTINGNKIDLYSAWKEDFANKK